ncbi:MAG TPA: PDZ domain-containing protein, partial [Mucilaginibacter sp.]|nr:PDZ domain-containing protein [Mucilaginibacter sp.]
QAHRLLENRPASVRLGGGRSHPLEAIATLDHVRFAGVDFRNVPSIFPTDSVRGSTSTLVSGNIGLETLSRFRVIMDYSHDRLYVLRNPKLAIAPFLKDRSGLFLVEKDSNFMVEFVAPGSPAQKAGFKAGERVIQINQVPVGALQGKAWQKAALGTLKATAQGTTFVFTMEDGSTRQFKAADFF